MNLQESTIISNSPLFRGTPLVANSSTVTSFRNDAKNKLNSRGKDIIVHIYYWALCWVCAANLFQAKKLPFEKEIEYLGFEILLSFLKTLVGSEFFQTKWNVLKFLVLEIPILILTLVIQTVYPFKGSSSSSKVHRLLNSSHGSMWSG